MLENGQLEFLVSLLELGPRDALSVAQTNADRVLAEQMRAMIDRHESPFLRFLAIRLIKLKEAMRPLEYESAKAAEEVLMKEVNVMVQACRPLSDRGPLNRHKLMEADTIN